MEEIPYNYSSAAIGNLSQAFEGTTQLHALFLSISPTNPNTKKLAIGLIEKSLRCITAALSELQSISPSLTVVDRKKVYEFKKRKRMQSWTIVTSVPHFDGHQWRKYGQKRIHGSEFPRSYYKCTYQKDQGCPATKTIQQKQDKFCNPSNYKVSYNMHHTCKPINTQEIPFVMDSTTIIKSISRTAVSSAYGSNELTISSFQAATSHQPQALPLQVRNEKICDMESTFLSPKPRGEANGDEDMSRMSPLAAFDFDLEWHDDLIMLGELVM